MEKYKSIKIKVSILLLIVFLVLQFLVITNRVKLMDNSFYTMVEKIIPSDSKTEPLTLFFKVISDIGGSYGVIFILMTLFIKESVRKLSAYKVSITVLTSAIINIIIKNLVMRPRPQILNLINEKGYSFPSGHAMNNSALYISLILIIVTNMKNKNLKRILLTIFSIMPLLISFSRVYLGVHYLSDILAGMILGISIALFFSAVHIKDKKIYYK